MEKVAGLAAVPGRDLLAIRIDAAQDALRALSSRSWTSSTHKPKGNAMSKPLNENLTSVRVETEDGDLLPVMDVAGTKFSELINAVAANNKAGTLTLKIAVKPLHRWRDGSQSGSEHHQAEGHASRIAALGHAGRQPLAEDPRQTKLDLKAVAPEPVRELKAVSA